MQKYLKRKVYEQLVQWKKQSGRSTLEVTGARQVGKTYIVNKFADEHYKNKIYINLLDFAGELLECNIMDFKAKSRCYFTDLGLANYFLTKIGCSEGDIAGIVNENFVYLDLKKELRIQKKLLWKPQLLQHLEMEKLIFM